jgi:hypothetical protein
MGESQCQICNTRVPCFEGVKGKLKSLVKMLNGSLILGSLINRNTGLIDAEGE